MEANQGKTGIFVYGMPGSGKSRFLNQFLDEICHEKPFFTETRGLIAPLSPPEAQIYKEYESNSFYLLEFEPLVNRSHENLNLAMDETLVLMFKKFEKKKLEKMLIVYCQPSFVEFNYEVEFFIDFFPANLNKKIAVVLTFIDKQNEDFEEIYEDYKEKLNEKKCAKVFLKIKNNLKSLLDENLGLFVKKKEIPTLFVDPFLENLGKSEKYDCSTVQVYFDSKMKERQRFEKVCSKWEKNVFQIRNCLIF